MGSRSSYQKSRLTIRGRARAATGQKTPHVSTIRQWLEDERELPYWTYDAPFLMRETDRVQFWGGPLSDPQALRRVPAGWQFHSIIPL